MRKLFVLLCYSVALLFLVSACGNTEDDSSDFTDSAVELGEEFIKELYIIDDPSFEFDSSESMIDAQNEFSSYLTEKEFEELAIRRFFLMPLEAASKQNSTIAVQNIEFEQYDRDPDVTVEEYNDRAESESLDFNHSFTLIFTDQEGNEVEEVKIKGQMTVVDTEDGLKIDRYYDSEIPVDLLYPAN
ncbi:MAG TPA: hypothetical protein VK105_14975 [Virgibacillus sp.]|nr:hypothetical protein [Virgibacillus sp.]HLR68406.1 hypothetical protein [Virgibacillus sp.]